MIRAVLFDIGGVLEITPGTGWVGRWDARLGISLDRIFDGVDALGLDGRIGSCSEAEWLVGFRQVSGLDAPTVDAILRDMWAEYLGTLDRPLFDFFAGLRPAVKTGIISNSFVGAREREQAAYHFETVTDDIVYSHEVGFSKPDPRIYQLACRRLDIQPAEAVFVDDHEEMLLPARVLGMQGILHSGDTPATIAAIQSFLK